MRTSEKPRCQIVPETLSSFPAWNEKPPLMNCIAFSIVRPEGSVISRWTCSGMMQNSCSRKGADFRYSYNVFNNRSACRSTWKNRRRAAVEVVTKNVLGFSNCASGRACLLGIAIQEAGAKAHYCMAHCGTTEVVP